MYVLSDDLGDELRDAQMLLAAAIHGEKRLCQTAEAESARSGTARCGVTPPSGLDPAARIPPEGAALAPSEVT
jgi:hypothetical protein